jgi:glycerophosphoryl diester phosphodiesterase
MTTNETDSEAFRVNLICACQNDVAYGYGATVLNARYNAERAFVEHHGRKTQYRQVVVEQAVAHTGGAHYETLCAGLHYEFTRGVGIELYGLDALVDDLHHREHATHPYVFESNNPAKAQALCDALQRVICDSPNAKVREAAQRAADEIRKLARAVWG